MTSIPKIEQALMFLCLNGDDNYREIAPQLIEDYFADDTALKTFKLINAIMKDGKQPTFVTFGQYATKDKALTPQQIASVTQWGNDLMTRGGMALWVCFGVASRMLVPLNGFVPRVRGSKKIIIF